MPTVSSLFLVLAFALAVVIGPQTRPWTWGPSFLALGAAVLAALPAIIRRPKSQADFGLMTLGAMTAGWFIVRAWISPVAELGRADLLLAGAAVGTFVCIRGIMGDERAERVLTWGIALLLLANVIVIGNQVFEPTYAPVFRSKAGDRMISGFFAHYNEAANYLIASSMLVAAAALFGKHRTPARIFLTVLSAAGLVGIWYTRSRGGILGAAVAGTAFFTMAMVVGKRRDAKWFAPLLIAVPLVGTGLGAFLLHGWMQAQELRQAGSGLGILMDNNARLYFLGIAFSCISLHPVAGGGARSFGWECFQFVEAGKNGDIITHKPDFVHNELVQSATDYGLLGAGLLILLLLAWVLAMLLRGIFEELPADRDHRDAWRVGAFAAFAGMMVQSSFSFVFHLLPGVLLLGICLGQMSRGELSVSNAKTFGTRTVLVLASIASLLIILPSGWKGAQVTVTLWDTHYGKTAATLPESRLEALEKALSIWPHSSFHLERAAIQQESAGSRENPGFMDSMERALSEYQEAGRLHPYEPGAVVNRAIVLGELHRDEEAEATFLKAISLQGGMEPGFRSRFSMATHLLRKSIRIFDNSHPEAALEALERSAEQMETACGEMHYVIKDMLEPRIAIHESLGVARETSGDIEGALAAYNFASGLQGGRRAHYRAAVLIGRQAVDAWYKRRPAEALSSFTAARKRIDQSLGEIPAGVTPSMRLEFIAYLDDKIAFLKGAKVEPLK